MSIAQGWADARSRARQGIVGDAVYSDGTRREGNGINSVPQAAKTVTVTVTDQGDDDAVILTLDGVPVLYNTGTGQTLAQIGAGIAAAVNANPLSAANWTATFLTATLTLTSRQPGVDGTVSIAADPASVLSAVTTTVAAAAAAEVQFGRAIITTGYNPGGRGSLGETERLVGVASTARFTAQVQTLAPTFVTAAILTATVIEIRGGERHQIASVSETSVTTLAVTLAALLASLNAALPANTVNVTGGVADLVFTAEIAGLEFTVDMGASDTGATIPAIVKTDTTGPSAATSLHRAWCGISKYSPIDGAITLTGNAGVYAPNRGVVYILRGVVWVASEEAPVQNGTVHVELAPGVNAGRFFATGSSTRVALSRAIARWERDGLVASDSLAAVRLEA